MTAGTEIELRQPRPQAAAAALPAKVQYARELANSGLLPAAYRKNPGNVLYAVEFGEMLGLAPMAAITGVHVIEGKPTASAGLISALVRRAGHKLRVKGDSKTATCSIVRADDPDFTFEVTWTLRKNSDGNPSAEEAGLLNKNTWKNYPSSMLKSRAITQCARDACEEALFGLHYTAEELGAEVDEDGAVVGQIVDEPVPGPSPEQTWLAAAIKAAPGHSSMETCTAAWHRSAEHVRDGKLTKAEAGQLQDVLRKRMEELKAAPQETAETPAETEVVDAEIVAELDPEDPWAAAIEGLASAEDAEILLADMFDQLGRGEVDPERAKLIAQAVEARFPAEGSQAAAA